MKKVFPLFGFAIFFFILLFFGPADALPTGKKIKLETFRPGETGILVRQGDAAQMAQEVAALLEDRDRMSAMGAAGREWVEANLSLDKMVDRYESLLERVAAGWRAGS